MREQPEHNPLNSVRRNPGLLTILFCILAVWMAAPAANAVPAYPDAQIEVTQPDGTTLTLKPVGDERNGRLVTLDGYTVVKVADGSWRYADTDATGNLVASDVLARPNSLRTAAEQDFLSGVQKSIAPAGNRLVPNPKMAVERTSGGSVDLATGATNNVLVILIDYPDESFTYPVTDFDKLMNQTKYAGNGSVNDFYLENSYGQFGVNGVIHGWYTAQNNRAYYGYNNGNNWVAAAELAREAVVAAVNAGVDLSPFDNDGNGVVDGLFIVHAGPGAETGASGYPWSHAWSLTGAGLSTVSANGVTVNGYTMEPEKHTFNSIVRIGVFCHEYGHALGLPDLYDTDGSSIGIGNWCLMAGGTWNGGGSIPAHMSAWCKVQKGWVTPQNVTVNLDDVVLTDVEQTPTIYRLWSEGQLGAEYFLVEYRRRIGFDAALPGCGVAVWHIDETRSNNTNDLRRLVDLEEADGSENSSGGDMFIFDEFTPTSSPNSDAYNGSATGVEVIVKSGSCETDGMLVDFTVAEEQELATFSIDHVDGAIGSDSISAGPVVFHIRATSDPTNTKNYNINNAFRLYSPDGATWSPAVIDTAPGGVTGLFTQVYFPTYDGANADTVGIGGLSFTAEGGIPPGYDDIMLTISTTIDGSSSGKTICIDSSWHRPSGVWKWAALPTGEGILPLWTGANCFTISSCCVGMRGNVDGDVNDQVDVGDLTALIDFLFINSLPLDCPDEADIDPAGPGVDIGDITSLIGFLFLDGAPPADCF